MPHQYPASLCKALEKYKENAHATNMLITAYLTSEKNEIRGQTSPLPSKPGSPQRNFAFSFDIDGVLHRGDTVIRHASAVMKFLLRNSIPFIFLTNSGGQTEEQRISDLSEKLKAPLRVDQFVQSHTPVKTFLEKFRKENILVIGGVGDKVRLVSENYGFESVVTTADLKVAYKTLYPFGEIAEDSKSKYYHGYARPLPAPISPQEPETSLSIKAVFVFSSSRDWGLDMQIVTDLLRSIDGVIGTERPKSSPGQGCDLIFCNPDVVWSTAWIQPRFSQGAFKAALKGIWGEVMGTELRYSEMGKPTEISFAYGEKVLNDYRTSYCDSTLPLQTVYHIGDSIASDVLGTNNFRSPAGVKWKSILVETGIYQAGTATEVTPDICVPDVRDAINWVLKAEGWLDEISEEFDVHIVEPPAEKIVQNVIAEAGGKERRLHIDPPLRPFDPSKDDPPIKEPPAHTPLPRSPHNVKIIREDAERRKSMTRTAQRHQMEQVETKRQETEAAQDTNVEVKKAISSDSQMCRRPNSWKHQGTQESGRRWVNSGLYGERKHMIEDIFSKK